MEEFMQRLQNGLDRLFRRGSKVGGETAEWFDQRATVYKLSSQMRGLARQRRDILLEMGKKVYALHQAGKIRNHDVLADCHNIDEIIEQIKDLEAQIEALNNPLESQPVVFDEAEPLTDEPADGDLDVAEASEPTAAEAAATEAPATQEPPLSQAPPEG